MTRPPRLGPVGRPAAALGEPLRRAPASAGRASRQPPLRGAASKGRWAAGLVCGGSGLRITCGSGGAGELRLPLLPRLIASPSPPWQALAARRLGRAVNLLQAHGHPHAARSKGRAGAAGSAAFALAPAQPGAARP